MTAMSPSPDLEFRRVHAALQPAANVVLNEALHCAGMSGWDSDVPDLILSAMCGMAMSQEEEAKVCEALASDSAVMDLSRAGAVLFAALHYTFPAPPPR